MTKILFILQCWALVPCLDIFVLIVSTPTRFPVSWPMKSPNYLEKAQPSRHTPTESLVLNIYVIQQPPRLRGGEDVYMAGSSLSPSKDENDQHQEDVEDLLDIIMAERRKDDEDISWESAKKELKKAGKL